MWQHWLGNTKPKKAFRFVLNAFKKLLKNYLMEFSTACLPVRLPSDSRNSKVAKATGLIFSLFDIASAL